LLALFENVTGLAPVFLILFKTRCSTGRGAKAAVVEMADGSRVDSLDRLSDVSQRNRVTVDGLA